MPAVPQVAVPTGPWHLQVRKLHASLFPPCVSLPACNQILIRSRCSAWSFGCTGA